MKRFFKYIILKNIFYFFDNFLFLSVSSLLVKSILKKKFIIENSLEERNFMLSKNFNKIFGFRFFSIKDSFIFFKNFYFFKSFSGYRLLLFYSKGFQNMIEILNIFLDIKELEESLFLKNKDNEKVIYKDFLFKVLIFKAFGFIFFASDFFFLFFYFFKYFSIFYFLYNYFIQFLSFFFKFIYK